MKNTFKKIAASVMAAATLTVGAAGMSASASTGIGMEDNTRSTKSYWNVHRISGAPSSTDAFSDSGNGNVQAKCNIQSNVKANTGEYAYIGANTSSSTCLFKSGWYSICGGNVTYSISVVNYAGYGFNIDGYAW